MSLVAKVMALYYSSWLTSLPLKSFGYLLNQQEFTDAIALRYNMNIKDTSKTCVCGENNTINPSYMQTGWLCELAAQLS